jgi:hypothetical protein
MRELALNIYALPVWVGGVQISGTNFQARMEGLPNKTYFIEATEDFQGWSRVATNSTDSTGVLIFTHPVTGSSRQRHFRAVTAP